MALRSPQPHAPWSARLTRRSAAMVLIAGLLGAPFACRSPSTQAPEDLPRGTRVGSTAPMTDREASRSPQPTVRPTGEDGGEDTGEDTGEATGEALVRATAPASTADTAGVSQGIDVPGSSSAARTNWRPRTDGDDGDDGAETGDGGEDSDDGDGEAGDDGDDDGEAGDDDGTAPSAGEEPE